MRKAVSLILLMASFIAASSVAYPAELNLGPNNFAVKLDSIHFTDGALKSVDNGFYTGLEGYGDIGKNFYIGAEVGYAKMDGSEDDLGTRVDEELIFIPIELNLKYTIKIVSRLIFDIGVGGSYNYVKETDTVEGVSSSLHEWLWGGQFFADINYKVGQFFLGANGKYQLTKNAKDFGNNFNNWRVGGQIGVRF